MVEHADMEPQLFALRAIWTDAMSAGDRSTIVANLATLQNGDNPSSMTVAGSPVDRFWQGLLQLGWAIERPDVVKDMPPQLNFTAYAFSESGADSLPPLLASFG